MYLAKKKTYRPKDIQCFSTRKRKITKLLHFDTYRQEFTVIMASLEKRQALSVYDHDDYFWSGIQPTSLHNILELELRSQNLWMDRTLPPSMGHVINVATSQLECTAYQPQGRSLRTKSVNS